MLGMPAYMYVMIKVHEFIESLADQLLLEICKLILPGAIYDIVHAFYSQRFMRAIAMLLRSASALKTTPEIKLGICIYVHVHDVHVCNYICIYI